MNLKILISLLFAILAMTSCIKEEDGPEVLKTSEKNLHFSGKGGTWMLTINSNTTWNIEGATEWCTTSKAEGTDTENINITVSENPGKEERSTDLEIVSSRNRISISVVQDTLTGDLLYELPVVFHVIHDGKADSIHRVEDTQLARMVEQCNALYRNSMNSVDMNLRLVMASEDPEGNLLSVPGVNRILRSTSAYQSSANFFSKANTKDKDILWNPNKFINVYVFTFTEKNTLGLSILPYTPNENSLPGLYASNYYYLKQPDCPWGIALNNTYTASDTSYRTLAHELGHYLGLFHVFSEKDCSKDSDYCEDTPNYNRSEYEKWLSQNRDKLTFEQLCQRQGCDGSTFTSTNVMDYEVSLMDRFTPDQFARVRHVLENSPLIPGPKSIVITKAAATGPVPPIRTSDGK